MTKQIDLSSSLEEDIIEQCTSIRFNELMWGCLLFFFFFLLEEKYMVSFHSTKKFEHTISGTNNKSEDETHDFLPQLLPETGTQ